MADTERRREMKMHIYELICGRDGSGRRRICGDSAGGRTSSAGQGSFSALLYVQGILPNPMSPDLHASISFQIKGILWPVPDVAADVLSSPVRYRSPVSRYHCDNRMTASLARYSRALGCLSPPCRLQRLLSVLVVM